MFLHSFIHSFIHCNLSIQSTWSLKNDLLMILNVLEQNPPDKPFQFIPRQHDVCSKFQVIQKLYGREKQTQKLLETFDLVSQGNHLVEVCFLHGYNLLNNIYIYIYIYYLCYIDIRSYPIKFLIGIWLFWDWKIVPHPRST